MADASDLKSEGGLNLRVGSNPASGTNPAMRGSSKFQNTKYRCPSYLKSKFKCGNCVVGCAGHGSDRSTCATAKSLCRDDWLDRRSITCLGHLRMTGWFEFERPANHRLAITTDRGTVYFQDPRRFGVIQMLTAREKDQRLTSLGPEPLARGFNLNGLQNTSRAIKLALLDQQLVAGIGNIYASESLWRARIHPRKRANRLRAGEREALRKGIIVAFRKAINYGPRIFAIQRFAVYERENKPCRRCGTRIRRIVQGQRSTYFCSQCQR